MHIAHFTNTFLPHVGGVARAVQTLLEDQRKARHRVLVVAPEFAEGEAPKDIERSVARIPAITHFNDSDFSVRIPGAAAFTKRLADFPADILHAHHPFLLGDTALREAASRQVPVIFTHHTLYERYTHYLPFENPAVGNIAADVATRFANACSAVIAPSESVRELILSRGVSVPVHTLPTGIDCKTLASGNPARARRTFNIPSEAVVVGHLGRLAEEKNLGFLAAAIGRALRRQPEAVALIVGEGPSTEEMCKTFGEFDVTDRVIFTGTLTGTKLHDALAAMDIFAFASTSETQGLVLAEAMASGTPVVALSASGVNDVVTDGENGRRLSARTNAEAYSRALASLIRKSDLRARYGQAARATAASLDRSVTSKRLLEIYREVIDQHRAKATAGGSGDNPLKPIIDRIATEGRIIADKAAAVVNALREAPPTTPSSAPSHAA